ncbi:MAG: dimethyl sulfoxide reductase anchor subunit [Firmicutes bacterium]|jgi:DMSO reductase anchor subunit|nr:dimethyl sulfoxide reductase anchor subunit [Bacillota bacterium]
MKAPIPLLLITVLQGVSGGLALALAIDLGAGGHVGILPYGIGLVLALIGGAASFTHMHQLKAGRFMLRGWRTSWLSREALTTSWYIAALVGEIVWLKVAAVGEGAVVWAAVTAGLALLAMFVTAMVYSSIPAMLSWHSPLTTVGMMLTGIVGGWMTGLVFDYQKPWETAVALGLLALWAGVRALQVRFFIDARRRVMAATGTGLPRPPYRLQDTGTTKPPYRTQTQIAPELSRGSHRGSLVALACWMIVLPLALTGGVHLWGHPVTIAGVRAASVVVGSFIDRWLFFRDASHSSRVWFADQLFASGRSAQVRS